MEATAGVRKRGKSGGSEYERMSTGSAHDSEVLTMHPITGTFADPERESAFAAQLFRLAFPCHAFLMALLIPLTLWAAQGVPRELRSVWYTRALLCSVSLVGRVLTHCVKDPVRSQRIGSWCWTVLVLLSCCVLDMYCFRMLPAIACDQASREVAATPLIYLGAALVNGSHGLGFQYKTALIGLVLAVDILCPVVACGSVLLPPPATDGAPLLFIMAAGIAGFVLAHMAELLWRHSIASRHAEMERLAEGQRSLEEKVDDERRRLEERNEQLRAEKERLLYDNAFQRQGRHFDENDDRSAIGRGLQAEPSQPSQPLAEYGTGSSESGGRAPSGSPPASLPPGPPSTGTKSSRSSSGEEPPAASSTAGSTAGHPSALDKMVREALGTDNGTDSLRTEDLDLEDLDLQTFSELERMLLSATEGTTEGRPMAAVGRPVLDGRGPWLGQEPSQGSDLNDWFSPLPGSLPASVPFLLRPPPLMLSLLPTVAQQRVPLPAQTHSGVVVASVAVAQHPAVASVSVAQMMAHQQGAIPHMKQEAVAVNSTLQEQGHTQQSLQSLASDLPAGPSCNVLLHAPPSTPGSLGGQSNMSTSQQQALHVARQAIRLARVDVEVYHVVRTLAIALGASRTEGGTIKALHAVLLQLERPELSCEEARGSTGASMSNFKKWQRRVHHARLNLPGESRVNSDARTRDLD